MKVKKGCSMIVFLMILVVGIFVWEYTQGSENSLAQLKNLAQKEQKGCSSEKCPTGGPTKNNEESNGDVLPEQVPDIMGHDNGDASYAAPF